jgi:hypothetical protein
MGRLHRKLIPLIALIAAPVLLTAHLAAQNFGMSMTQKKVVLNRKLPPTGHIAGTTVQVVVTAPGLQSDLAGDLKSNVENILLRNDSRLRSADATPDTLITCIITSYAQPPPQSTVQSTVGIGKGSPIQKQALERVTGVLTVGFQAKERSNGRSLASDNITAKFDQEFSASGADKGFMHSITRSVSHMTKGGSDEDTPPTPIELHNRLVQDAAQQIAAHLVNTTEQVEIYLARGGGLDEGVKLGESQLWSRALESFETMKPFSKPDDDAYRLYDIGVANEALAYQSEDVKKARTYLQEAAIHYGKAIDAKPTERKFLSPQTRIDTALAHYKALGDQVIVAKTTAPDVHVEAPKTVAEKTPSGASNDADALTNDGVIGLVSAKIDDDNVIDTIRHAKAVKFDLSVQGQINLSKNGVSNKVLTAMKARERGPAAAMHRAAAK